MTRDEHLILTFFIIVIIILMSPDLTSAMLIISILANIYILTNHNIKRQAKKESLADGADSAAPKDAPAPEPTPKDGPPSLELPPTDRPPIGLAQPTLYGDEWDMYTAYKDNGPTGWSGCNTPGGSCGTVYNPHVDIPEGTTMGIDQATVEMARRRARDKMSIEGQVLKDANFYKYHYGTDLVRDEKKPWWGNSEY